MTSLLDDAGHRTWLHDRETAALSFAQASIRPEGGFHYLGADRRPLADRPPALFLTARMAWVSSAGVRDGIPGSERLLDHAMDSLLGFHWDAENRGWLTQPGTPTRKATYDHMHCAMAASGALAAGHPRAHELLDRVVDVVDTRLWDEDT